MEHTDRYDKGRQRHAREHVSAGIGIPTWRHIDTTLALLSSIYRALFDDQFPSSAGVLGVGPGKPCTSNLARGTVEPWNGRARYQLKTDGTGLRMHALDRLLVRTERNTRVKLLGKNSREDLT